MKAVSGLGTNSKVRDQQMLISIAVKALKSALLVVHPSNDSKNPKKPSVPFSSLRLNLEPWQCT